MRSPGTTGICGAIVIVHDLDGAAVVGPDVESLVPRLSRAAEEEVRRVEHRAAKGDLARVGQRQAGGERVHARRIAPNAGRG